MKQLLIISLLWLATATMAAQAGNVDSLLNVLETQKLTPDEIMDVYYKIGAHYVYNDQEKFKEYATKGLALANKEKNKKMITKFTMSLGIYYNHKASYDSSIVYYEKAYQLAQEINDKEKEADICGNIAASYCNKGEIEKGISYYHRAISISESIGSEFNLVYWFANMGARYRQLGEYELAINYLKKAEDLGLKHNELNALSKVYSSLGNLYLAQKELDKAIEYGFKSLKVSQDMNNKLGESYAYQIIINTLLEQQQYDEAEKYAKECLRVATEVDYKRGLSVAWHALSNIYLNQGHYQDAEQASYHALEADTTNLFIKIGIMGNLSQINILLGNKEKAMDYFQKFIDMKDEFNNNSIRESLMEQEVKYESEKKEMRIASLERERKMFVWLGIAGVLMVVALGIALLQRIRNIRKEQRLIASEAIQEGEIGERTRIAKDLHDRLGNSLTAVKIGLGNAESLQNISEKLDMCMKEVREITNNVMPRSLHLFGMKGALEDFCTRYANLNFHFFGTDQRIKQNLEYTVYCCARELANNAIKHSGASTINMHPETSVSKQPFFPH